MYWYEKRENIKICIKIGRLEWFKKYVKAINLLAKEYQNNDGNILEELYNLNMEIEKYQTSSEFIL